MAAGSAKPVTLSDATTNTLRVEMTAASNGAEYCCFITDANHTHEKITKDGLIV